MTREIIVARASSMLCLLIGFCLISGTCADEGGDGPVPAKNEMAMSPGMKITATTPNGTITITAGRGLKRSYTWESATRSVEMWPRDEALGTAASASTSLAPASTGKNTMASLAA